MSENEKGLAEVGRLLLLEWRRKRRWSIFFRFVFVGVIVLLITSLSATLTPRGLDIPTVAPAQQHAALVKVDGPILRGLQASSGYVIDALEQAFENEHSVGVIIEINTPGGSPVQSSRIAQAVIDLRAAHPDKPVYVVISEVCASGGMYIATAADEIYAHPDSIVGSIGVIAGGFGFTEMMEKVGVERRLLTAGEHKALLDPFLEEKPEEVAHVRALLAGIHERFIARVKAGRGDKLADDPKLFSGLIWTGHKAKELGLVDDFGDVDHVAETKLQTSEIHEYRALPVWFDGFLHRFSVYITQRLKAAQINLQSPFLWH